jgi:hypothetical protein
MLVSCASGLGKPSMSAPTGIGIGPGSLSLALAVYAIDTVGVPLTT